MAEMSTLLVTLTASTRAFTDGIARVQFSLEEMRIAAGRVWLAMYLEQPWHRRLAIDIRRWRRSWFRSW